MKQSSSSLRSLPPEGALQWLLTTGNMKPFAPSCSAHAEDGVPGLRSANSDSQRPGNPPSTESVAFDAARERLGDAAERHFATFHASRVARSAMDH